MPKDSSTDLVVHQPPPPPAQKRTYTRRNPDGPRVPPADGDIQSNHCRNINCANFGVPPKAQVPRGRPKNGEPSQSDGYRITAQDKKGRKRLALLCTKCGQHSSLKSNSGIREELDRISAYAMLTRCGRFATAHPAAPAEIWRAEAIQNIAVDRLATTVSVAREGTRAHHVVRTRNDAERAAFAAGLDRARRPVGLVGRLARAIMA